MNSKKHKLPRRILAMLLAICMFVTMFPSAMFAVGGSGGQQESGVVLSASDEDDKVSISKIAERGTEPGTWDVTMTVTPKKDIQAVALDVVLVLDSSGSMAWDLEGNDHGVDQDETRNYLVEEAAKNLVGELASIPDVNVGVVDFDSKSKVVQSLVSASSNVTQLKKAIESIDTTGGTDINAGLEGASSCLEQSGRDGARQVVILLSDGYNSNGSNYEARGTAESLRNNGVDIYTIGFADGASETLLADICGSEDHFYPAEDAGELTAAFTNIANEITAMINDYIGEDVAISGDVTVQLNGNDPGEDYLDVSESGDRIRWNPSGEKKLKSDDKLVITYTVSLKGEAEDHWNEGKTSNIIVNDSVTLNYGYETTEQVWVDGHWEWNHGLEWVEGYYETQTVTKIESLELASLKDNVQVGKLVEKTFLEDDQYGQTNTYYGFVWENNTFTWTMPAQNIVNDGVSYNYQNSEYDKVGINENSHVVEAGSHTLIHNYTAQPVAPEPPSEETVIELLGDVTVDCVNTTFNEGDGHAPKTFDLTKDSLTIPAEVTEKDGVYTIEVSVAADSYVTQYNAEENASVNGGKQHTLTSASLYKVTLTYDEEDGWIAPQNVNVKFDVACDNPLGIDSITKTVVTKEVDGISGSYDYPVDGKVTVDKGENVTILYAITITGDPGASFTVTDEDATATLKKVEGATLEQQIGATGPFTGTLNAGTEETATATLYVAVDYGAMNNFGIVDKSNTALVENGDKDAPAPNTPEATEEVEIEVLPPIPSDLTSYENAVKVQCINEEADHDKDLSKTYNLNKDTYTADKVVTVEDGNYTFKITVNTLDSYVEQFNKDYSSYSHTLNDKNDNNVVTLQYDQESNVWKVETPATVEVKCENAKSITDFTKEVLTQKEITDAGITDTYDNPTDEDGKVVVKEGESATLLYKITVKGDPGAAFEVKDTGATLVKATGVELETESKGVFAGNIDAQGTAVVLYVSKTFENITTTAPLKNEASVTSTTGDYPDDPEIVEVDVQIVPEEPDVVELLDDAAVKVDCVTKDVGHGEGAEPLTYGLLSNTYKLEAEEGGLHYTLTITDTDAYVQEFNKTLDGHTFSDTPNGTTINLNYKDGEWEITDNPVLIEVTCPSPMNISSFDKQIVDQKEAEDVGILNEANQNTYTFPDDKGKVTVKEGDTATLLYKFVVEGTPNTKFTVQEDVHTTFVMAKGATITVNEDGNYEGTIPDSSKAVFYVSKTFKDIPLNQETLDNTATIVNNSTPDKVPGDGTTTENVPVTVEPLGAFTKTLITQNNIDTLPDAVKSRNDIVFPALNEDGTVETVIVPKDGSVTLLYAIKVEGEEGDKFTVTDKGADLVDANGYDVTENNEEDTFTGTVDKSGGVIFYVSRTFTSDEVEGDKLVNRAEIDSDDIDLEPGEEEQEEDVPATTEDLQVVVTPANVTIYEGGKGGYDGVGEEAINSTSLPHPMFYIDAPEGVDPAGLTFVNGDKVWTVAEDGLDGNAKNPRMLYHFEQGADQDPVRVTYTYVDADGNETTVLSDNLDELDDVADVYTYLRIDLYAGENNLDDVKASVNGTAYSIEAKYGQLTVRAVEADDPNTVTSDIRDTAPTTDEATAVAVEPENTTYTLNNTDVELPEDSQPSLLFDNIINDDGVNRTDALENKANQKLNANDGDYNYEIMYLDLVDANNGNAWITSSKGTDIYWDYPEGTDINTDFEVLHFTGLHRDGEESGFDINDLNTITMDEIENVTIEKTDDYIVFHVKEANFSPYALAWEDDGGQDWPPYHPWQPDGDDDGPSGLNTEDHFSYVVGYAEDYRTGEATDNEDLWPVKPNNQITRAEVATIFYRLLEDEVRDEYDTTTNDFSDVTADSWYNQTVSTLARMGIVKGYEDGSFRPNAPITRAEFGAIATRFFAETGATYVPGTFTDVTGDEWYANAIQDAVNLGLIGGYPDGTVRPNNNITRAEACAIVNRTLGRVPDADHLLPEDVMKVWPDNNPTDWFYADMQEATNGHEYAWIEEDGHEIEEWTNLLDKDWTDR